ncbi:MAG: tripartite tricarboxylate transporter TctB family protein [Burkholderiales bacterium]|nr:tripartite tricarboxylate transporter TctB family protein [Burkholderiales bacterium]
MADRIIFFCTIVLAAVYFYATAQIPSLEIGDPLGPRAFPRLLGIGLLITAGMLFMEMWRARKAERPRSERSQPVECGHFAVVAVAVVWTGLYFAVFEWLGYAIATTVYLLALMMYFNRGRRTANILTSVLFSFISYLVFSRLLDVTLARGILPF